MFFLYYIQMTFPAVLCHFLCSPDPKLSQFNANWPKLPCPDQSSALIEILNSNEAPAVFKSFLLLSIETHVAWVSFLYFFWVQYCRPTWCIFLSTVLYTYIHVFFWVQYCTPTFMYLSEYSTVHQHSCIFLSTVLYTNIHVFFCLQYCTPTFKYFSEYSTVHQHFRSAVHQPCIFLNTALHTNIVFYEYLNE